MAVEHRLRLSFTVAEAPLSQARLAPSSVVIAAAISASAAATSRSQCSDQCSPLTGDRSAPPRSSRFSSARSQGPNRSSAFSREPQRVPHLRNQPEREPGAIARGKRPGASWLRVDREVSRTRLRAGRGASIATARCRCSPPPIPEAEAGPMMLAGTGPESAPLRGAPQRAIMAPVLPQHASRAAQARVCTAKGQRLTAGSQRKDDNSSRARVYVRRE